MMTISRCRAPAKPTRSVHVSFRIPPANFDYVRSHMERAMRIMVYVSAITLAMLPASSGSLNAQTPMYASAIPDTPAGRQLTAYLAAVNSGDPSELHEFTRTQYARSPFPSTLESSGSFQEITGG